MKYLGVVLVWLFWLTVLFGMVGVGAKVFLRTRQAIVEVRNEYN